MSIKLETQVKTTSTPTPSFTPVHSRLLQRSSTNQLEPAAVPPIMHEVLRSPGQSLDMATRAFMEPRFGHDFSHVRVHTDVPKTIQTKLIIGQPNDRYEQEADRVAEQVMRMPEPPVQRQPEEEVEEEHVQPKLVANAEYSIQRQVDEEEKEEEFLQTKELAGHDAEITPYPESRVQAIRGGGQTLPESTRAYFEPRFGYDFNQVRVHTDTRAAESAQALNAKAFTVGSDIVFGTREYAPNSTKGDWLLAHELTHVKQQGEGRLDGSRISRIPTESDIRDRPPRYSYSTHCGWIDWSHAGPGMVRNLIAAVRVASQRMAHRETAQAAQAAAFARRVAAESPTPITESRCTWSYETSEADDSASEQPVITTQQYPSGLAEVRLGGFGVDSEDSTKFVPFVSALPTIIQGWSALQNRPFKAVLTGYTDCVGTEARNQTLRRRRSTAIAARLAVATAHIQGAGRLQLEIRGAPLNQYLASNAARQGRRINRGVRLQLVPQVAPATPERVTLPQMRSGVFGIVVSGVTPTIELPRSLSEPEVLQVSLGIFMIQSQVFETLQSWTDPIAHSSFSEEDLPSNLIAFYSAAHGYSAPDVRRICGVWNVSRSLGAFRGYTFRQNRDFQPPRLPPGGSWPNQFNAITPAAPESPLYNVVEFLLQTPLITRRCRLVGSRLRC